MTNINAAFFNDLSQQSIVEKQKAELYMQMYPYMAEDFFSSFDNQTYGNVMKTHIDNLQAQLTRLFEVVAKHTHTIPPHIHMTGKEYTPTMPTPLITLAPVQSGAIKWSAVSTPIPQNTTGAVWNITGNFKIPGLPSDGMLRESERRATPLPLTLTVVLPPILTAGLI